MDRLVTELDRAYATITRGLHLRLLVWPTRILLAIAFLPTGLIKVLGRRFTQLPASDPVGGLFAHLEAIPSLYLLIGIAQLTAAVLILVPWTALIGALVYLPVITGIVVITWSYPFGNTRIITALMLLGTVFLLCWDWPRLRDLLLPAGEARAVSVDPAVLVNRGRHHGRSI